MGEWIEHDGKGCPVHLETKVDVRWDNAPVHSSFCATMGVPPIEAKHVAAWPTVTHYRLAEPQQEQAHMMAAPTERAPAPFQAHVEMIAALTVERDSLRAEVERLTKELRLQDQANDILTRDNERLRKGREDEKGAHTTAEAARVEDARKLAPIHADLAKAKTLASNFTDLDPRLGMPQPEGEPVGPMSARKAYRWGMV